MAHPTIAAFTSRNIFRDSLGTVVDTLVWRPCVRRATRFGSHHNFVSFTTHTGPSSIKAYPYIRKSITYHAFVTVWITLDRGSMSWWHTIRFGSAPKICFPIQAEFPQALLYMARLHTSAGRGLLAVHVTGINNTPYDAPMISINY